MKLIKETTNQITMSQFCLGLFVSAFLCAIEKETFNSFTLIFAILAIVSGIWWYVQRKSHKSVIAEIYDRKIEPEVSED